MNWVSPGRSLALHEVLLSHVLCGIVLCQSDKCEGAPCGNCCCQGHEAAERTAPIDRVGRLRPIRMVEVACPTETTVYFFSVAQIRPPQTARRVGVQTCRRLEFVARVLGLKSFSLTEDSILRPSGIIVLMVMEEEPVK